MWKPSLLIILFIAIISAITIGLDRNVPPQHLPWKQLNPEAPLGFATSSQVLRMSLSPSDVCMDMARDAKGFDSIPADPRETGSVCGWEIARVVYGSEAAALRPGEANMQCPLAIGSYMTYSCRRQNGNNSGQWSEHAYANAWDITGFELEDGRIISVLKDWNGKDKAPETTSTSTWGRARRVDKL